MISQRTSEKTELLKLTTDIVSAQLSRVKVPNSEIPELIETVFGSLQGIASGDRNLAQKQIPAVPVEESVTPDFIICLEDGKSFKMLKKHLSTHYGMSPDEYRVKWGLPADYPMVAPNYAVKRQELAKASGLGRKR